MIAAKMMYPQTAGSVVSHSGHRNGTFEQGEFFELDFSAVE
jgi:hypothetical protein